MDKNLVRIIRPGVYVDLNSYWAMHYCSIFETLFEQKTIAHGFQSKYMADIDPTLRNFVARAGYGFFVEIKNSLRNFGLQSLLGHYLVSNEGLPIVQDIVESISDCHKFDFSSATQEYGVFVSAKDFKSGERFIRDNDPVLIGWGNLRYSEVVKKVHYADLCILLKGVDRNFAMLGEVEGNRGGDLRLKSFWSRKRGDYYSFGIGVVSYRSGFMNSAHASIPQPTITSEWIRTECGWKYVVTIDSEFSVVRDFHDAIGTIQTLMTLGPGQRVNYDPSVIPVIDLIKRKWDYNILDLIQELRSMLSSSELATLGTNPVPVRVVPSIIV